MLKLVELMLRCRKVKAFKINSGDMSEWNQWRRNLRDMKRSLWKHKNRVIVYRGNLGIWEEDAFEEVHEFHFGFHGFEDYSYK